jgi:hypothetical protein
MAADLHSVSVGRFQGIVSIIYASVTVPLQSYQLASCSAFGRDPSDCPVWSSDNRNSAENSDLFDRLLLFYGSWNNCWWFVPVLFNEAGYHRLWAHRTYKATLPIRFLLCLAGSGAFEGSIRWWCRDHRAHHRYTDTDRVFDFDFVLTKKDPYSARKGIFYSHIGWMLLKQDPKKIGKADISDLNSSRLVRWQHRNYLM